MKPRPKEKVIPANKPKPVKIRNKKLYFPYDKDSSFNLEAPHPGQQSLDNQMTRIGYNA